MSKFDWKNPIYQEEEFVIWSPSTEGEPSHIKILDWDNVRTKDFGNGRKPSTFIETDKGWLRMDSIRLRRELVKHVGYFEVLILKRWCDMENTRATTYEIEKLVDVTGYDQINS